MQTTIYRATADDLEHLQCIDSDCFEGEVWNSNQWQQMLQRPKRYPVWLIAVDQQIVGYAIFSQVLDEAELLRIGVLSSERGKGLARKLLSAAQSELAAADIENLYLEVRESNLSAQNLYRQLGWQQTGTRRAYYPTPDGREDAWLFSLSKA